MKINQLTTEQQEKAYQNWLNSDPIYFWQRENDDTLNAFLNKMPLDIEIQDYNYGYLGDINFRINEPDYLLELSGARLVAWLQNNLGDTLWRPKIYYGQGYQTKRRSRIIKQRDCNLTGYCMDEEILAPIYSFIKNPDKRNLEDIVTDCLYSWLRACQNDYEHCRSFDYFLEHADANGWNWEIEEVLVMK